MLCIHWRFLFVSYSFCFLLLRYLISAPAFHFPPNVSSAFSFLSGSPFCSRGHTLLRCVLCVCVMEACSGSLHFPWARSYPSPLVRWEIPVSCSVFTAQNKYCPKSSAQNTEAAPQLKKSFSLRKRYIWPLTSTSREWGSVRALPLAVNCTVTPTFYFAF